MHIGGMTRLAFSLVTLVLAATIGLRADDAPKPEPYVDPAMIDAKALLPTPPPNDSDATTSELQVMFQAQASRTQAVVDRIKSEEHYGLDAFADAVGPVLGQATPDKLPATAMLLKRLVATSKPVAEAAKDEWKRPAPFAVNSRIFPAIAKPTGGSYPSEQATRATIDSLVLASLMPDKDKADAVLARGREIGDDRVVAGVEFPSDVKAGRILGEAVFAQMAKDPQFQADLAAAKAELKAAR
jgi:acid phosphatase (class A)